MDRITAADLRKIGSIKESFGSINKYSVEERPHIPPGTSV